MNMAVGLPTDLLPHRPPFLFIDEVLECTSTFARACRQFRADESFFRGHFPGQPIVPGVLLLEGMAQTFAYLALHGDAEAAVYLTGVDRARFRRPVLPGQVVEFAVRLEDRRLGVVRARAEATVAGARVADATLMGHLAHPNV
jgi:3-hydroxyacyl-[acyl-carrier-protein] dehydratase